MAPILQFIFRIQMIGYAPGGCPSNCVGMIWRLGLSIPAHTPGMSSQGANFTSFRAFDPFRPRSINESSQWVFAGLGRASDLNCFDAFEEADLAELADVAPEIHRALEAGDRHPWQVRPGHHSGAVDWKTGKRAGPATDLTPRERQYLKHEAVTAARAGIKGSQRGPVPVNLAKPGFHRGQRWRSGKNGGRQGWGNRGGSTEKQRRYYMKIRSGAAFRQTLGKAHPHYGGGGSGGAASSSGK